MKLGFHISISGGLGKVVERAIKKECDTFQIFSRNPRGWHYRTLKESDIESFKKNVVKSGMSPVCIHLPYLPNLASAKPELLEISRFSLEEELRRANILGVDFVIAHIGSRLDLSLKRAVNIICDSINRAFSKVRNNIILLLENTAGEGSEVGDKFSVIGSIIDKVEDIDRIGVCLDTAHTFQAGYDLSTKKGLNDTIKEFDDTIRLKKLYFLHLNDSKTPLGSHRDLHWHIGDGYIGIQGFKNIVNHPSLSRLPAIMETPRKSEEDDIRNMRTIRRLVNN
ncbi:deoxyribonuclease IV [candidate division WOR-3 bacterium]|nr:deoxyribonuclease IV [candidate division WOR-3 bacterium]